MMVYLKHIKKSKLSKVVKFYKVYIAVEIGSAPF